MRAQDVREGGAYVSSPGEPWGEPWGEPRPVTVTAQRADGMACITVSAAPLWVQCSDLEPLAEVLVARGSAERDVAKLARWVLGRDARSDRRLVLQALVEAGRRGLTDHEHEARNGLIQTSAGVRRGELRERGLVESTGTKRPVSPTSEATVWRVTELGCAVWQILERDRRGAA